MSTDFNTVLNVQDENGGGHSHGGKKCSGHGGRVEGRARPP